MKNVLIRGVTGYLGAHLAHACLDTGFKVIGIANDIYHQPLFESTFSGHPNVSSMELIFADLSNPDRTPWAEACKKADVIFDTTGIKSDTEFDYKTIAFRCTENMTKYNNGRKIVTIPYLLGPVISKRESYGKLMDDIIKVMNEELKGPQKNSMKEVVDVRDLARVCIENITECKGNKIRIKGGVASWKEIAETSMHSGKTFGYEFKNGIVFKKTPDEIEHKEDKEKYDEKIDCAPKSNRELFFETVKYLIEQGVLTDVSSYFDTATL